VQVFKLVAKNTIEERINFLIEKKKTLIEEMIGGDEAEAPKVFSREDLLFLIEGLEE
jgi:SNF2 family DNA or RNA helicase